jgi:hypothetical protein
VRACEKHEAMDNESGQEKKVDESRRIAVQKMVYCKKRRLLIVAFHG